MKVVPVNCIKNNIFSRQEQSEETDGEEATETRNSSAFLKQKNLFLNAMCCKQLTLWMQITRIYYSE